MEDEQQAVESAHNILEGTGEKPEITDINSEAYTQALAEASIFEKTATIQARPAQAGEVVATTLADGTQETTNTANEGDFIVTNPGGEQYIVPGEKFAKRYEVTDQQDTFKAVGMIRAIKNPTGEPIKIIAPWGEEMNGDGECYVVTGYDPANPEEISSDRYIIGAQEFADTYASMKQSPETSEEEPPVVELARELARTAHAGQVDKLGVDYIKHPEAVAKRFEESGEWDRATAAWLHDVVEDSGITAQELLDSGVPANVVEVVDLLTRKDEVPDDEYYRLIAANPDALAVKLSDMRHNTDPDRQKLLDEPTRVRLINKYVHAAEMLGQEDFADELRSRLV